MKKTIMAVVAYDGTNYQGFQRQKDYGVGVQQVLEKALSTALHEDISIKAAQTGHLVLSTLHTNDAPTTLTRMRNMGIAPFNIASSVILITAQRLARRLCENCKAPADYPREALLRAGFAADDLDGSWRPYRAIGCSACNNGYRGRVGLYQVMPITEAVQRIILAQGNAIDIAEQARRDGVRDLRQAGLLKVRNGVTTLEEVISVTNQ